MEAGGLDLDTKAMLTRALADFVGQTHLFGGGRSSYGRGGGSRGAHVWR